MAFVLSILLLFFIIICTIYVIRHFSLRKQLAGIPSPRSQPFIGHALIIQPDIEGFIDQILGMAQIYPRMVLFWAGPMPTLMIYSAQIAESMFTNMDHINKGFAYDMLRPWLGNGLLTNYSDSWRVRRKLLTPTFHYDILKNFQHVFNHQAEILVRKLNDLINSNGNIIDDITPLISLCTLDIICETSMGKSVNAQGKADSDYVRAVLRINDIIHRRQKNPLMWPDLLFRLFGDGKEHAWALNILHSFTRKVIIERRRMREQDGALMNIGGRLAFLDLLLEMEQNGSINETDIQHEVDTFMFEGHDTTAAALVWLLFMLGTHEDIQQRCYEEINSICGPFGDVNYEDLSKLTYLECCVKETLRLYPSAPFITRTLGRNAKIGGHELPEGTQVMLNIYLIHRDPEQWKDPEIFNPDRFMRQKLKDKHAFAYVPFSAGSRNCIGQRFALLEEKTLIIWILRKFHVKALKRRDQIWTNAELILRPGSAMPIKLTPRIH